MIIRNLVRARHLGVAATAALGFGLATASSALAAPAGASVANDTLTVNGSSHDDVVALRLDPTNANILQVDVGNDGTAEQSFDRTTFSSINVFLGSGNDELRVGTGLGDEGLTVDAGSGDDRIFGGDNAATIMTGSGNDTVQGGNGAEFVDTGSGNDFVDGNKGNDSAVLGSGNDAFQWDPGDGSDSIDGSSGTDSLIFNGAGGAEVMSLSANGSRAVFLRDVANIRMDMDNVERLDLRALGGADKITMNDMTGTDFRQADIDLGGADNAIDETTVVGTNAVDNVHVDADGTAVNVQGLKMATHISGSETADKLTIDTKAGNDAATVDPAVNALIGVTVL